jgi:hypothetical protein
MWQTTKSFRMLGFIKRTCASFTGVSTLKSLYICYVRSQLEYCSVIWSPWQSTYVDRIERVQYKFIKYMCFKSSVFYSSSNYESLCTLFNLPPLYKRRLFLDVNFLYKVVNSHYDCSVLLTKVCFSVPARRLRSMSLFRPDRSRINIRKYSPVLRCMDSYNGILETNSSIDMFCSLNTFKHEIRATLF